MAHEPAPGSKGLHLANGQMPWPEGLLPWAFISPEDQAPEGCLPAPVILQGSGQEPTLPQRGFLRTRSARTTHLGFVPEKVHGTQHGVWASLLRWTRTVSQTLPGKRTVRDCSMVLKWKHLSSGLCCC